MKAKTEALEMSQNLPDDAAIGMIYREAFFNQQVEKGPQDVAERRVLTHQASKESIARWRKYAGR